MSDKLFPDGDFTFVESGGETFDDRGKVHWPALLRVQMSERKAIEIMQQILSQLLYSTGERPHDDLIDFTLVGTIKRQDEEGNRIAMDGSELEANPND